MFDLSQLLLLTKLGSVFTVGQTNTTEYLVAFLGNDTDFIQTLEAAYPPFTEGEGSEAWTQVGQIFTEMGFQCAAAFHARDSAAVGIPTWRYYFNASFTGTQPFPQLGVFHASEIPYVFSTYPRNVNVTTQEYALSRTMRNAWATFAKNPAGGPGWNPVSTGVGSIVLASDMSLAEGANYMINGTVTEGTWDLGVFGNVNSTLGSGITVVDSSVVDFRCGLYEELYERNAGFV